jgi:hypothetical protein
MLCGGQVDDRVAAMQRGVHVLGLIERADEQSHACGAQLLGALRFVPALHPPCGHDVHASTMRMQCEPRADEAGGASDE